MDSDKKHKISPKILSKNTIMKIIFVFSILLNVGYVTLWLINGEVEKTVNQKSKINESISIQNEEKLNNIEKESSEIEIKLDDNDNVENKTINENNPNSEIREQLIQHYRETESRTEDYELFETEYFDYFENVNMEDEDFYSLFEDEKLLRIQIEIEVILSMNTKKSDSDSKYEIDYIKNNFFLGILHKYFNDYEKALKALLIAEKQIDNVENIQLKQAIFTELGKAYFYIYEFSNSIKYFTGLITTDESYYIGYYWRGISNLYSNRIEDAMNDFDYMFKLENQQNDINLNHYEYACISTSKIFKLSSQIGKAIEYAEKSTEYIEDNITSLIYVSQLYLQIENYSKAEKIYNLVKSIDKENEGVILLKCQLLRQVNKKYEQSLIIVNELLFANPDYYLAYNERGKIFTNLRLYDSAFNEFNRAITIEPMYANAYGNRGWIYYKYKNEPEKAFADYNKAIMLDTNLEYVYNNRGVLYMEHFKNNNLAISDFSKALVIKPGYYLAYVNRGLAKRRNREYHKAIADFLQAIKIDDVEYKAFYQLGKTYYIMKEYTKSIENYTKAIDRSEDLWELYFDRAKVKFELKNYGSAKNDLNFALKMNMLLEDNEEFKSIMKKCLENIPN
ncbi:MAG: hypothetical protein K8S87_01120 [Planctomycetes bacterium]|nr:hypothetical protein [Planctomycetota bacterium]